METFYLLFNELLILYLIMLVGFMGKKYRLLDEQTDDVLTRLLLYITLPALILYSMDVPYSSAILASAGWLILFSSLALFIAYLLTKLANLLRLPLAQKGVWQGLVMFGNQGFLGYSLCYLLLGEKGVVYAALFNIPYLFLIWTYGIMIVAKGQVKLRWTHLCLNPGVLATSLGFLLYLTPFSWPSTFSAALESIGLITIPLSMITLGSFMARIPFRKLVRICLNGTLWLAALLKLILLPMISILPLLFLPMSFPLIIVVLIITAMPSAPTISLYAQQLSQDALYAAVGVMISTVLALFTVPALYLLTQWIGQMWLS